MRTVYPAYDREHYLTRAQYYARAAEHEPDPEIRQALRNVERECRRKAEKPNDRALLDC
jgi:hypothetical protein